MQNEYKYSIGLMSGTSLDGLDLVYVKMNSNNYSDFEIIHAKTERYSTKWKRTLQQAIHESNENLEKLHYQYGELLGEMTNAFIEEYQITKVDFIASHGHTVFHQPENGITVQIGDGQKLADITNCKVICDFRTQDVELKGQGAPLVPIGDELLFPQYNYCLNLGGFANVSFKENNERVAFDICPVNIVLNHYTRKIGLEYDEDGVIAANGIINSKLLDRLNALHFYKKDYPKSLGLEWVQQKIFPLIDSEENEVSTIIKTFTVHSAQQIAAVLNFNSTVLITGGGAYNSFLINEIKRFSKVEISKVSSELIEFKEALVFAFLGLLKDKNEINCLRSVTGAIKDHSSGKIFTPNCKKN